MFFFCSSPDSVQFIEQPPPIVHRAVGGVMVTAHVLVAADTDKFFVEAQRCDVRWHEPFIGREEA